MLRTALRSVASQLAARVDEAIYNTALVRSEKSRRASAAESLGHEARIEALGQVEALYEREEFFSSPDTFFTPPAAGAQGGRTSRLRSYDGWGEVLDVGWRSAYEPFHEGVRERYERHDQNGVAVARVFAHRDPCPAIILIHGYLGGTLAFEERFWPVRWLFDQGLDVALMVLPFHGARRQSQVTRPVFPSSDPRFTVEGFRQAIFDLRWLMAYLEARGSRSVGAMGMSLGGYTTALLATVEPRLSFAVPLVPLASIADFARDGGRLVGSPDEQAAQHAAIEGAHRVVSPLARPSKLADGRVLVLGGEYDRITPLAHAERLAAHLGAPLETFAGGHLFQVGRGEAFKRVERMIAHAVDEDSTGR
jgi:pimeloyl-ACP methyl ester carboxylesterase